MDAYVTITGNLGTEVDFTTDSGTARAHFRMAHTRRRRRGSEWSEDQPLWVRVNCGYQLASNVKDSLAKGDAVIVSGRLRVFGWVDQGGHTHEMLIIDADTVGHDLTRGRARFSRGSRQVDSGQAGAEAVPDHRPQTDSVLGDRRPTAGDAA